LYDEVSFNRCHDNYDNIAQVYQHRTFNGAINTISETPVPLGAELRTNFSNDFKRIVRSWWPGSHVLSHEHIKFTKHGTFMDPEALDMFSFTMLKGNRSALNKPASVVLSQSTATALFGDEDSLNRIVRIDNAVDAIVTGVFKEFPENSRFHTLQFVSTWDSWVSSNEWLKEDEQNWNSGIMIFTERNGETSFESLSARIGNLKAQHVDQSQVSRENPVLFLHPMSRWHLYSEWRNGKESGGRIQYVWLFGIIGAFVLFLACINFMNLSTAQSERRAREVGIRKSIGSARSQLILQFLVESFLITAFAFTVSVVIAAAVMPWFNILADKNMQAPWSIPYFWPACVAFVLITSLLAGSYPALYLSSFRPLRALKGSFSSDRLGALPRKSLVVTQFTVSVMLVLGTIVVWQQIQFARDRPVGYTREGLIMVRKISPEFWGKSFVLRNELKASGAVMEVAESSSPVTESWFHDTGFTWRGKDPDLRDDFALVSVTHEYGRTMGWEFIQGRDYSRDFSTDSSAIVLNEAAVHYMGLSDPINEEITWNGRQFKVIGVIKDMIIDSPYAPAKQTIFWLHREGHVWINMRINPEMGTSEALGRIEQVFQKLIPSVPFDFKFADDEFARKFAAEVRMGSLSNLFSFLAILISCLGLLGMASFVAEQRKKEVGVRKILGASGIQLWRMLSAEFVLLAGISCAIGLPLGNFFLNQWLSGYEYRTELSWWVYGVTLGGAIAITLLTVSFHTIRVVTSNPVKSLKSE
jgi:putative ABC transport system permease protein